MDQKILDKIKKLLALGMSDNPNEASLAIDKANQLMQQHQLSMHDVELSSIGEYMVNMANTAKKQPIWHMRLIDCVASAFGVEAILSRHILGASVVFIGVSDRIEIAAYCYSILSRKITAARKKYIATLSKRYRQATKTEKADMFCDGFVIAIAHKVTKLSRSEREEALLNEYMSEKYQDLPESKAKKSKKLSVNDALQAGFIAGSEVQLHHGVNGEPAKRLAHA